MAALAAACGSTLSAPPRSFSAPRSSSLSPASRGPFLGKPVRLSFSHPGSLHFSPLPVRATTRTEETVIITPTSTSTSRTPSTTATEETSVQAEEFLADLKAKWDAVENKTTVVIYGGGALVALWLSSAIVGAVNSLPLLPKILELVGLGYTSWFVYRYLLFKESRKELVSDIEVLKSKITGAEKI